MDKQNNKNHQQIGQELELFFNDEIAPGTVFWLPKGMILFRELEKYILELTEKAGYLETSTPIMVKTDLFKQSGHWEKFGGHNMYNLAIFEKEEIEKIILKVLENKKDFLEEIKKNHMQPISKTVEIEINGKKQKEDVTLFEINGELSINPEANYSLKPMNCPESTVIYRFRPRSHHELPLRLSEIGRLHRKEKSGEVNGLLRVRQLTMDDAHIYAKEDQIFEEVGSILDMMIKFYKKFSFEFDFRLATRPELYAGTKENWAKAEEDLEQALKIKKLPYTLKPQDGAFYGPKIDVHIKDTLGREWQLATVQLDFHQPKAFKLEYTDSDGQPKTPVMIHRAIFGSFERFIAILTEQYQGAFPTWLSPIQVAVLPISDKHTDLAENFTGLLNQNGIRTWLDAGNEPIGAKIRYSTLQKIPYMCIIGAKEEEKSKGDIFFASIRKREGTDLGVQEGKKFLSLVKEEIEKRL